MTKLLRVCDIVYFQTILSQSPITSCEITLHEFMQEAKRWRRKHDARFLMPNIACDNYTAELVAKVNAIPHVEPDLTQDETIALLTLLYEQRLELGPVWMDFCNVMKSGFITFHIGVSFLVKWANLVLPTQPPETKQLDRLLNDLFVHDAMKAFYVKITTIIVEHYPPFETLKSIYEFNYTLCSLLPWDKVQIFATGIIYNDVSICFSTGWTEDLTAVLKNVKKIYSE